MSSYLELVQQLHAESGSGGPAPQTVIGQKGEAARLVAWIKDADNEIQSLWHNWKFLWSQHSLSTASGTDTYAAPDNIGSWDRNTFYLDSELIDVVEYENVRTEPRETSTGRPFRIVVMPNNSLRFDKTPNASYSVTGDYFIKPIQMVNNADQSLIPSRYHSVIIAKALQYYANYESAQEIKQQAAELLSSWLPRLESSQLPESSYRYQSNDNNITIVTV